MKICRKCGSRSLIADRSLGGRIVCSVCGSLDIQSAGLLRSNFFLRKNNRKIIIYSILILIVLILIF